MLEDYYAKQPRDSNKPRAEYARLEWVKVVAALRVKKTTKAFANCF
jgi:hypothetical protein